MSISYVTQYGEFQATATPYFNLIDNYIYLYHTDTLILLPTFPDTLSDKINTSYTSTSILGRSAPIYSFTNSGPRSVQIDIKLHRDMMNQINTESNNFNYGLKLFQEANDESYIKKIQRKDYVDLMINELQSIALPNYVYGQKLVDPPLVAVRIGDEIFCKGIVDGGVSVNFNGPILANPLYDINGDYLIDKQTGKKIVGKGKYAMADISFTVTEVDPYDAQTVAKMGSFRGLDRTLEKNLYKVSI